MKEEAKSFINGGSRKHLSVPSALQCRAFPSALGGPYSIQPLQTNISGVKVVLVERMRKNNPPFTHSVTHMLLWVQEGLCPLDVHRLLGGPPWRQEIRVHLVGLCLLVLLWNPMGRTDKLLKNIKRRNCENKNEHLWWNTLNVRKLTEIRTNDCFYFSAKKETK